VCLIFGLQRIKAGLQRIKAGLHVL